VVGVRENAAGESTVANTWPIRQVSIEGFSNWRLVKTQRVLKIQGFKGFQWGPTGTAPDGASVGDAGGGKLWLLPGDDL
jgi:hypothetical protein